jgi:hypothetical protein
MLVHFLCLKKQKITMENKPLDKKAEREMEGINKDQEQQNKPVTGSNTEKDPDEWTTGNEPMTGAQRSYLKTLSDEAGETFDENLTKAEASKRIDELQHKTGRGLKNKQP